MAAIDALRNGEDMVGLWVKTAEGRVGEVNHCTPCMNNYIFFLLMLWHILRWEKLVKSKFLFGNTYLGLCWIRGWVESEIMCPALFKKRGELVDVRAWNPICVLTPVISIHKRIPVVMRGPFIARPVDIDHGVWLRGRSCYGFCDDDDECYLFRPKPTPHLPPSVCVPANSAGVEAGRFSQSGLWMEFM